MVPDTDPTNREASQIADEADCRAGFCSEALAGAPHRIGDDPMCSCRHRGRMLCSDPDCPTCRASLKMEDVVEKWEFSAYGYEVVVSPYFERGQWLAEIDGVGHSYENYEIHPCPRVAILEALRWCKAHPMPTDGMGSNVDSEGNVFLPGFDEFGAIPF